MRRRTYGKGADKNTLLLLHFNDTYIDDSNYASFSVHGTDFAFYPAKFNNGLFCSSLINAVTNYVNYNMKMAVPILKDCTIECFYSKSSGNSTGIRVSAINGNIALFGINFNYQGTLHLLYGHAQGTAWDLILNTNVVLPNKMIHFAITHSTVTNVFKVYVDGVNIYTETIYPVTSPAYQVNTVTVHCDGNDIIDEVRISDVVRYTENFTPPTKPFKATPPR